MACIPLSGYYDDGNNSQAKACIVGCSQCANSNNCLNCLSGYYISGSKCISCGVHCSTCTSSRCTACIQDYTLNLATYQCINNSNTSNNDTNNSTNNNSTNTNNTDDNRTNNNTNSNNTTNT